MPPQVAPTETEPLSIPDTLPAEFVEPDAPPSEPEVEPDPAPEVEPLPYPFPCELDWRAELAPGTVFTFEVERADFDAAIRDGTQTLADGCGVSRALTRYLRNRFGPDAPRGFWRYESGDARGAGDRRELCAINAHSAASLVFAGERASSECYACQCALCFRTRDTSDLDLFPFPVSIEVEVR